MAKLISGDYNQIIEAFNQDNGERYSPADQVETLKEKYDGLTKLSDAEEIIVLLNLCIAEDRYDSQSREDLYNHYLRLRELVKNHEGSFGIDDYGLIIYDLGILSFKFHDYSSAIVYLKEAREDLYKRQLQNHSLSNQQDYLSCMILYAYSLEYKKIGEGALDAIRFILGLPALSAEGFNSALQSFNIHQEAETITESFFSLFKCDLYDYAKKIDNYASNQCATHKSGWRNELVHVMAHCLSEYSVFLKKKRIQFTHRIEDHPHLISYSTLSYKLEIISEKFIECLGKDMITCRAIINAEHGLYWTAINKMVTEYDIISEELKKADIDENAEKINKKKKAELAFYIYYFNNRVSNFDDTKANECKDYFLSFANASKNVETKYYADIINFREKFANAIVNDPSATSKSSALASLANEIQNLDDKFKPTYIHPQIKEEKEKLLLAYKILLTYYQQISNTDSSYEDPVAFLEKCILFNTVNEPEEKIGSENYQNIIESNAYKVEFCGICIHFVGLTSDFVKLINKVFITECRVTSIDPYSTNTVFICDTDEKIKNAIKEFKKTDSGNYDYQVYLPDELIQDSSIRRIEGFGIIKGNRIAAKNPEEFINIVYVQRTIKNCLSRAKRWDECFISAPITDNETFAFQSKNIDRYIYIKKQISEPEKVNQKELFKKYAYVDTESSHIKVGPLKCIPITLSETLRNKFSRLFYYNNECFYEYSNSNNAFIPTKLFDETSALKASVKTCYGIKKRFYYDPITCNCDFSTLGVKNKFAQRCCCYGYEITKNEDDKIRRLLREAHVKDPSDKEEAYVLILSDEKIDDLEPLCSYLLVIEESSVEYHGEFVKTLFSLNSIVEELEQSVNPNSSEKVEDDTGEPMRDNPESTQRSYNFYGKTIIKAGIVNMSNRTEYNFNEKVKIDKFIGGDYYDHRSLSKEDLSDLKKCVTETGITKDDLNAFGNAIYEILEEGIHSQNDILNELVKLSLNFEESRKTGFTKNLQEKVSLTNGMISIGKTAAGLISQNPTLTVSGVIDAAKEFAK